VARSCLKECRLRGFNPRVGQGGPLGGLRAYFFRLIVEPKNCREVYGSRAMVRLRIQAFGLVRSPCPPSLCFRRRFSSLNNGGGSHQEHVGAITPVADDNTLPVLSPDNATLVVAAPGYGPGYWAGGPSAVLAEDGTYWLAYRLRRPLRTGRGYANVIARSDDGVSFETVAVLDREEFDCDSLERPALVALPDGSWRIYVSCATRGTDHWRVDVIDADRPSNFAADLSRTVLSGDQATVAVKDPVVKVIDGLWHMWLCCHPLDQSDATDRMTTVYGTSLDGLQWDLRGTALAGVDGRWDQRATRVADVLYRGSMWVAYYDGRASKEENAEERTGIAFGDRPGQLVADGCVIGSGPDRDWSLRYTSCVELPDGGLRLYYETRRLDGAHDLRTEYVPPSR
jgi:hypothetical protein